MAKLLLDHIIILLPYQKLLNPPHSLARNFIITPGGRHADNRTENKLIILQDGSYIELIAFINDDPKLKEGHPWGNKEPGIIDFAFTTSEDVTVLYSELTARLEEAGLEGDDGTGEKFGYQSPVEGGRVRDDGVELKWKVTFPEHVTRGELPFFCHDVTPRSSRVPSAAENTTHPSRIYGVVKLAIKVSPDRFEQLVKKYNALLDTKDQDTKTDGGKGGAVFSIHAINPHPGGGISLHVDKPSDDWEKKFVKERGYWISEFVVAPLRGPPLGIDVKLASDLGMFS